MESWMVDHPRGFVCDRFTAEGDCDDEICGDQQRALETVVGIGNARGEPGRWF